MKRKQLVTAIGFLSPNFLGVLAFVIFPVAFSIVMAFTNWDLRRHNMFKTEQPEFLGLDNFIRLLTESEFRRYLGNTLFMMMGIPLSVAGSLFAAMLLSKDTRAGGGRTFLWLLASGGLMISVVLLAALGLGGTGMTILLVGVACGVLAMGMTGGLTVYRTFFYMPHFTTGVATFLVWKKMYNAKTGPINTALQPVLDKATGVVDVLPAAAFSATRWLLLGVMVLAAGCAMDKLRRMWRDGELSSRASLVAVAILFVPGVVAQFWSYSNGIVGYALLGVLLLIGFLQMILASSASQRFTTESAYEGLGTGMMLGLITAVGQFVFLGLSAVAIHVPVMAATDGGLNAPEWITDYHWAKPSLMIMAFWSAIGSNNMLLYLAALTNVPQELYEASDIDGANRFQRFWHVTWPQLAPTTFFILVMSTIGGLQGGFEAARTMTDGGPAGSTTTLSYYIYLLGFETGRLGFASAVAWTLFILIFGLTLMNWKFGNKYVND